MKALRITAPRHAESVELPDPRPAPGEILLRVDWLGLCGSDLNTWKGANPLVSYPRIPGHEVAGTVLTPSDGWSPGDRALVVPYTACGRCSACFAGRPNCCRDNQTLGVQRDGALCGLIAVPTGKLLRVPGLDGRELALVEPLSVGFHAAARGRAATGETVAVIGCGAVGIGAIAGAAARGAHVVAIDIDERKLALARVFGAAETIDARGLDLTTALRSLAGGEGPHLSIEAAGQPASFRACVEAACFAGRVVYIGYAREPVSYETKLFVQKELDVLGSRNATRDDFSAAAAWVAADPARASRLVTHSVPFASAADALRLWEAQPGAVGKILVEVA